MSSPSERCDFYASPGSYCGSPADPYLRQGSGKSKTYVSWRCPHHAKFRKPRRVRKITPEEAVCREVLET